MNAFPLFVCLAIKPSVIYETILHGRYSVILQQCNMAYSTIHLYENILIYTKENRRTIKNLQLKLLIRGETARTKIEFENCMKAYYFIDIGFACDTSVRAMHLYCQLPEN